MKRARKKISLKTKLASTICTLMRVDENGQLVRIIPQNEAERLSEDEILSRVDWDHDPIPKSQGGPDTHWNLTPLLRADHRAKTAKRDIPQIAKTKRITRKHEEFRRRLMAKGEDPGADEQKPKRKWSSRPFRTRSGKAVERRT